MKRSGSAPYDAPVILRLAPRCSKGRPRGTRYAPRNGSATAWKASSYTT
jgi:hypothetical protein